MDNTLFVVRKKSVILAATIVLGVISLIMLICGAINSTKPIPAGTTYTCERNYFAGSQHDSYKYTIVFHLNGTYEYKSYENDKQLQGCIGMYTIVNDKVSLSNYVYSINTFTISGNSLLQGDNTYRGDTSWLTIALFSVGIVIGLVAVCGIVKLREKSDNSNDNSN